MQYVVGMVSLDAPPVGLGFINDLYTSRPIFPLFSVAFQLALLEFFVVGKQNFLLKGLIVLVLVFKVLYFSFNVLCSVVLWNVIDPLRYEVVPL